jgi:hypothetical protein
LYACDAKWWEMHHENISFNGEKWTQDIHARRKYLLNWVLGRSKPGLGRDCVHFGGNSGYQAINLAYLWGAKRIVLLGFDCKPVNGKDHWFGQHPRGLNQVQPYQLWLNNFVQISKDLESEGIEVINCSMLSALQCFKKAEIATINH